MVLISVIASFFFFSFRGLSSLLTILSFNVFLNFIYSIIVRNLFYSFSSSNWLYDKCFFLLISFHQCCSILCTAQFLSKLSTNCSRYSSRFAIFLVLQLVLCELQSPIVRYSLIYVFNKLNIFIITIFSYTLIVHILFSFEYKL